MLNPSTLTPFSRRFYERVCALRPDWRAHARPCEEDARIVEFVIPSPVVGKDRELLLTSADLEYTWFYENFHTHHTPESEADEERATREAVEQVTAFMNEALIIECSTFEGQPGGGELIAPGDPVEPHDRAHVYTRSSHGTYDREYPPQPKPLK